MSATELLCHTIGINHRKFSRQENLILEAELFVRLYDELKNFFKSQYKDYFHLMKFNTEMEEAMLEVNFIRCVINDILATEEYSLSGIANYTQMPEDAIYDVAIGKNLNPSLILSRKIIELHRTIRRDLYHGIIKKITTEDPESV